MILITAQLGHALSLEYKKPPIHLKGVSFQRIDWKKRVAETRLTVAIDNPGPAFKLKDLAYRLKLNDKQAAEGKLTREIDVPAHSSATIDLPCSVDLSELPGVAWGIVAGGFDVHYEMETEFTVPVFANLNPGLKTSIAGDLSLAATVSGWTAKIKERISRE